MEADAMRRMHKHQDVSQYTKQAVVRGFAHALTENTNMTGRLRITLKAKTMR